ncbi:MAG TPA: hypothetical protein VFH90_07330 [Candidatus Limnocylindria bacterium]|nr:hypothetical protein [Candidatus Limnocylindria bacterium]
MHVLKLSLRATALLAVVIAVLGAGPVAADCQPVESVVAALESAEVAFVGTAVAVSEARSSATFRVEETWAGTVGPSIEVFGLNGGRGVSEDDRTWQAGKRYLVIPYVIGGQLADHLCSGTTPWTNELAALRPPGSITAEPAEAPAAPPWPVLIAVVAVLVMALVGWLAFRRERPT